MSKFRPRRLRAAHRSRSQLTERERWMADRYKPHAAYTAGEVRRILIEDACNRWPTPLHWFATGIDYVALREHSTSEKVFQDVRTECIARTGLDLPRAGVI